MVLSDVKKNEKHAQQCKHCSRNILLPYEHDYGFVFCGYNVTKRKNGLSKT